MKDESYFRVTFPSFSPIYVWERTAENAVIRAKYQRLEEKLSTDVMAVEKQDDPGVWTDCGISDFAITRMVERGRADVEAILGEQF